MKRNLACFVLGMIVACMLGAAFSGDVTLKDGNNRTVGYIRGEKVYNDSNSYVGRTSSNGVYDKSNRRIAQSPELVGWLIEKP